MSIISQFAEPALAQYAPWIVNKGFWKTAGAFFLLAGLGIGATLGIAAVSPASGDAMVWTMG